MVVKKLDRIFDSQNVIVAFDIDLIDHGRKRRRLTRTSRAGYQNQAARLLTKIGNHLRQTQCVERFYLVRDRTKYRADRAFLVEEVRTKSRHAFQTE